MAGFTRMTFSKTVNYFPSLSLDLLHFNETPSSLECRSQCSVQSQFTCGMFAMVPFSMVPLVALCLSIQVSSQAG